MFSWFKKLFRIVANYDSDAARIHNALSTHQYQLRHATDLIKAHTNIAVDVGFHDAHHVIVVGRYRGQDYVNSFSIKESNFGHLIQQLKEMERYGTVRRMTSLLGLFER